MRIPLGARREQASRSASTSASAKGSAGNRRVGFRFTPTRRSGNGFSVAFQSFRHCMEALPAPPPRSQEKRHSTASIGAWCSRTLDGARVHAGDTRVGRRASPKVGILMPTPIASPTRVPLCDACGRQGEHWRCTYTTAHDTQTCECGCRQMSHCPACKRRWHLGRHLVGAAGQPTGACDLA